jgi:hypothetical protein
MWDFELLTMEKTQPPVNDDKGPWYRYSIANKITTVDGVRRGSKAEVTQFIDSTLKRLNSRHLSPAGRQSVSL